MLLFVRYYNDLLLLPGYFHCSAPHPLLLFYFHLLSGSIGNFFSSSILLTSANVNSSGACLQFCEHTCSFILEFNIGKVLKRGRSDDVSGSHLVYRLAILNWFCSM